MGRTISCPGRSVLLQVNSVSYSEGSGEGGQVDAAANNSVRNSGGRGDGIRWRAVAPYTVSGAAVHVAGKFVSLAVCKGDRKFSLHGGMPATKSRSAPRGGGGWPCHHGCAVALSLYAGHRDQWENKNGQLCQCVVEIAFGQAVRQDHF